MSIKIGVTMSDNLGKQVIEYAEKLNISRASAVCVLVSHALEQDKALQMLPELVSAFKKEQDKQEVPGAPHR